MHHSLTPAPDRTRRARRALRFLLIPVFGLALAYLLFEALYSTLYVYGFIFPPNSMWIFENRGTVQFDRIRGYRLTQVPSRQARITLGQLEYLGVLRGNAAGFPDEDEFGPRRTRPGVPRIAVFGDSFTAGQHFARSWPAAVEDITAEGPMPLDLLNFSIDGGGIANWWSVLTRLLVPRGYDLDGIVFAAINSDLNRNFTFADDRGREWHAIARARSWAPRTWPKTLSQARPLLQDTPGKLLSPEQFDAALRGEFQPPSQREWGLYGWRAIRDALMPGEESTSPRRRASERLHRGTAEAHALPAFLREQERLIEDIAKVCRTHSLPCLIVWIPLREEAIDHVPPPHRIQRFAEILGAPLVDGSQAFEGLSEAEIRANWFPYDGHWSQVGSDRFAAFIAPVLQRWIESVRRPPSSKAGDG